MATDIEKQVRNIAATVEPPEQRVSEPAIDLAVKALDLVEIRYGAHGETPRPYHNVPHSIGVYRRAVRLTNLLYPYINQDYREGIYDLATIGPAVHDVRQDLGPHKNERASVKYGIEQVKNYPGSGLDTETFKKRLWDGGMVTDIDRTDDGRIIQTNLRHGSKDPHKFIMAFADINGIAMEGYQRMAKDATNLCFEIFGDPTIDQLQSFLVSQQSFLRQRLNDKQIKPDIAYYFPEHTDEVYGIMRKAFHQNIISSHQLARAFGEQAELQALVGFAARRLDRSMLGNVIGRALKKYVSVQ